jgi:hypothetical protein
MPRLPELDEFLDEDLTIPLKSVTHPLGRDYTVAAPDIETVLWLKQQMRVGQAVAEGRREPDAAELDNDEEIAFMRRVMGPAYDEMIADGVKSPSIQRVLSAVIAWMLSDSEDATDVWTGKAQAEAKKENRAERRKASRGSGSKKKTGTGAGSSSRQDSTSSTKTPR